MKCERCGYENYDESHYCKRCWAELASFDGEGLRDRNRNRNRNNYPPTYNYRKNLYDGDNKYIKGLYDIDSNNNYTDANRQYSSDDSTQYSSDVQHNFNVNTNTNSQNAGYEEPMSKITDSYYDEKRVPSYISQTYINNDRYGNSISANRYGTSSNTVFYTDETRERANRSVNNFIMAMKIVPVVLFVVITLVFSLYRTSLDFYSGNPKEVEETVEATQPTIPEAKLGYSTYSIIDTDTEGVEVLYHPPKGYDFIGSGSYSCAVFESDIYENTVSLTTMFFKDNIEEEIDYYESMGERDGTEVAVNVTDTEVGKIVEIKVANEGKGINYQIYMPVDKERYIYISMTNVPFDYEEDAKTILSLLVEDLEISYFPVEEKTEAPTE